MAFGEDDFEVTVCDFGAAVGYFGIGGWFDSEGVGGAEGIELGFAGSAVGGDVFFESSGGLLDVSVCSLVDVLCFCVWVRGVNVLCQQLARVLFGDTIFSEGVEVAWVNGSFPWDAEDRGEFCFEVGDLDFPIVTDWGDIN